MDYEAKLTIPGLGKMRFAGYVPDPPEGADVTGTVLADMQRQRAEEISRAAADPMNEAIRLDRERMKAAVSMAAEPTITKLPEEAVTGEETPEQAAIRVNQELRRDAEARLRGKAERTIERMNEMADERDKAVVAIKDAEDRADAAECRALELTGRVDTYENLITDFATAMTDGPFGLPWWLKASRAFDAMTDLAGADQG